MPEVVIDAASHREHRPTALGRQPQAGTLFTSDDFLTDVDALRALSARGGVAIDMETSGVARVCEEHGCAWSVFRGISDDVFDPAVDGAVLDLTVLGLQAGDHRMRVEAYQRAGSVFGVQYRGLIQDAVGVRLCWTAGVMQIVCQAGQAALVAT